MKTLANQRSTVKDILAAGEILRVDLLRDLPDTNNPAMWNRPTWESYVPASGVPLVVFDNDGLSAIMTVQFFVPNGEGTIIRAVGISFQGSALAVAALPETVVEGRQVLRIEATVIVTPWES